MTALVLMVLLGVVFAYFATQNTLGTNLLVGPYNWANVPLYMIVLGSLLLGMVISWFISIISGIGSALSMRRRDSTIKAREKDLESMQSKLHDLELENARLRGEKQEVIHEEKVHEAEHRDTQDYVREHNYANQSRPHSIIDRIRHGLSV